MKQEVWTENDVNSCGLIIRDGQPLEQDPDSLANTENTVL